MLLAVVISAVAMGAYMFFARTFFPPPPAPAPQAIEQPAGEPKAAEEPVEAQGATAEPDPAASEPAATDSAAATEDVVAEAEQSIVIETATFVATFSNRGAVATSWTLKHYEDAKGGPLDLIHSEAAKQFGFPFALARAGGKPIAGLDTALFSVNEDSENRSAPTDLIFEYASGGLSVTKSFHFEPEGYLFKVETKVTENGRPAEHFITWNSAFGDTAQLQDTAYSNTYYYDAAERSLTRNHGGSATEERIPNSGQYLYAGVEDLFFTAAFLPPDGPAPIDLETSAAEVETAPGTKETFAALSIGGASENNYNVFVGPKSLELLGDIRPELRDIVDFGWFGFLAEPLLFMLRWTYENVVPNWGWSIVLVTVFINIALFPLKMKSSRSMKKMQSLQPLVKQINEKYKGLGMRDPKKAEQNQEMMDLYKKYGVNPMGGCFPMLLQMPFLFAFYKLLTVAIELRHAPWLWVADLSAPEQIAIRVLPIAMIASQFVQQAMTPTPTADPAQARMMKFMPLVFGFIFYGLSSGLVLYWLTSNLSGILQQLIINRMPGDEIVIEQPTRGRRKKKS